MSSQEWCAVVLAGSRGANDPMAKAYRVLHKCSIPIAGRPMLLRVIDALRGSRNVARLTVVIDSPEVVSRLLETEDIKLDVINARDSAPASAIEGVQHFGRFPVLVTTGDHPLLTAEMIDYICERAIRSGADVTVGLAAARIIQSAYPETKRTYFRLGNDQVSGCNLFTVHSEHGLLLFEQWRALEKNRKKPWKLVSAFGWKPLFLFMMGRLSLETAFEHVSRKLGISVVPLMLPFAEAAIDIDKPSDKELAESILAKRPQVTSP
jgi:GTP:adenosylcobinamide-phosphate guanylyltransferase